MALVFLVRSPRCLSVCTRTLFHRSPGIYSMTYSLFLFLFGSVSIPFLRLLSGPVFFVGFHVVCGGAVAGGSWSQGVSGRALCCPHRPGRWVRWGGLGGLGGVLQSAVAWGGVGRRGLECSRHVCGGYLGLGCC